MVCGLAIWPVCVYESRCCVGDVVWGFVVSCCGIYMYENTCVAISMLL